MKPLKIAALSVLGLLATFQAAQAAAPVITNIAMVPRLSIQSDLGLTNQIQYCTNLGQSNWVVLTNLVVTQSPYWYVDVGAPPDPQRFYRVVAIPPANMVLITSGSFTMGDTFNEGPSFELPLHIVSLSAFYMDRSDVTQSQWESVYQWATNHGYSFDSPASGPSVAQPLQSINWYDCVKWCNARSEQEGRTPAYYISAAQTAVYRTGDIDLTNASVNWSAGYRLPTEAEWEEAARGGLSGERFPWGNTIDWTHANYFSDWSGGAPIYPYDVNPTSGSDAAFAVGPLPWTSPVSYFAPNGYGLQDMAGNVFQWCWDGFASYSSAPQTNPRGPDSSSYRVNRGGSWDTDANYCRAAARFFSTPSTRNNYLGFRSVLPPGP